MLQRCGFLPAVERGEEGRQRQVLDARLVGVGREGEEADERPVEGGCQGQTLTDGDDAGGDLGAGAFVVHSDSGLLEGLDDLVPGVGVRDASERSFDVEAVEPVELGVVLDVEHRQDDVGPEVGRLNPVELQDLRGERRQLCAAHRRSGHHHPERNATLSDNLDQWVVTPDLLVQGVLDAHAVDAYTLGQRECWVLGVVGDDDAAHARCLPLDEQVEDGRGADSVFERLEHRLEVVLDQEGVEDFVVGAGQRVQPGMADLAHELTVVAAPVQELFLEVDAETAVVVRAPPLVLGAECPTKFLQRVRESCPVEGHGR